MTDDQRSELHAAMMLLEVTFGFGGDEWKQFPEFAGMDEESMAICAYDLIAHVATGNKGEFYQKAISVVKAALQRFENE